MSLEVDVRKLDLFNKISKVGSQKVADSVSQMTGLETEIRLSKLNFLHIDDVKTHIGTERKVGIHVELTESPYGYVLFLISPADSKKLARLMLPDGAGGGTEGAGFSEMERSAIQEIGNIMTSGYIDGWANVLETTIDMSTPEFTFGPSDEIIEKMGGWPEEETVFVLDSYITADGTDIDLTVYSFPQMRALVDLVQQIDVDTDVHEDTVASEELTSGEQ
jgi:chemotaxis protein CheC